MKHAKRLILTATIIVLAFATYGCVREQCNDGSCGEPVIATNCVGDGCSELPTRTNIRSRGFRR